MWDCVLCTRKGLVVYGPTQHDNLACLLWFLLLLVKVSLCCRDQRFTAPPWCVCLPRSKSYGGWWKAFASKCVSGLWLRDCMVALMSFVFPQVSYWGGWGRGRFAPPHRKAFKYLNEPAEPLRLLGNSWWPPTVTIWQTEWHTHPTITMVCQASHSCH